MLGKELLDLGGVDGPLFIQFLERLEAMLNAGIFLLDAVELLLRATTALRELKRDGDSEQVRAFDQSPLSYPT